MDNIETVKAKILANFSNGQDLLDGPVKIYPLGQVPDNWRAVFLKDAATGAGDIFSRSPKEFIIFAETEYGEAAVIQVAKALFDLMLHDKDQARFVQILLAAMEKWPEAPWDVISGCVESFLYLVNSLKTHFPNTKELPDAVKVQVGLTFATGKKIIQKTLSDAFACYALEQGKDWEPQVEIELVL